MWPVLVQLLTLRVSCSIGFLVCGNASEADDSIWWLGLIVGIVTIGDAILHFLVGWIHKDWDQGAITQMEEMSAGGKAGASDHPPLLSLGT